MVRLATLLLVGLLASGATAAWAQSPKPTLTLAPAQGERGSTFTATYAWNQACPSDFVVRFFWDGYGTALGSKNATEANCSATVQLKVPAGATCTRHTVYARVESNGGPLAESAATAPFTVVCPRATPSPTRTATARPSPTPSRTTAPPSAPPRSTSATARPTVTRTAATTPSPIRSATPSASSSSAAPVVTDPPVDPPPPSRDVDTSGPSRLPWAVGGGVVALVGIVTATRVLAPKGASKVLTGAVVVASVAGGAALTVLPTVTDPPRPLFGRAYTTSGTCAGDDIPLTGGFESRLPRPRLHHFRPTGRSVYPSGDGTYGYWHVDEDSGVLDATVSTVCLSVRRDLEWTVRSNASIEAGARTGAVSCQVGETTMTGGWYLPWSSSGIVGSYPESSLRWRVRIGAVGVDPYNPGVRGNVDAVCARVPEELRIHVAYGAGRDGATAVASCQKGYAVLNGGGYAYPISGSYPVDGGWAVQPQPGGTASAWALCYPVGRDLGLRASYTRSTHTADGVAGALATCDAGDSVLAGGWNNGHGFDTWRTFEPKKEGWFAKMGESVPGAATVYALCVRPY